jgi:hypothetical protein
MSAIVIHLLVAIASIASVIYFGRQSSPVAVPLAVMFCLLTLWQFSRIVARWKNLPREKPVLKMGGFVWSERDFCRGWLITGETGSGKTLASIRSVKS